MCKHTTRAAVLALLLLGSRLAAIGQNEAANNGSASNAPGAAYEEGGLYWQVIEETSGTYIVDGAGNRAPLAVYRRVILTSPGAVEVLYMIGAESSIAAISSGRDPVWPEDKTALLP
ncbi:MAG: hypothetical protein LBK40_09515, partial [Spirochaetaceae bacterium]|nr:hypothetical protein [Spirochaetaceae bacterium]